MPPSAASRLDPEPPSPRAGPRRLLERFARDTPALTLTAALLLTLVSTLAVAWVARERDRMRFENAVQGTTQRIRNRLDSHVALLHGARSLLAASNSVSTSEFRTYVRELEVPEHYPGIQGIGISRLLSEEEFVRLGEGALGAALGAGSDRLNIDVPPQFATWPQGVREEYHAILMIEPATRRNVAALGFDMFSDSTRRAAMLRARRTGEPALSGLVRLVQELDDEQWQPGFLIYLPLYSARGGGTAPAAEREFLGFVYAPFRAHLLFQGIFASDEEPRVAFAIHDGEGTSQATLLFDSDSATASRAARFAAERRFSYAGHDWTISFRSPGTLGPAGTITSVIAMLLLGVGLSWLLYARSRAEVEARAAVERSDALRVRFFASMSHELRTPLNAIIGYTELLLHGIGGPLETKQAEYLERSQRAARHLHELVNDVLDLSRLESGKIDIAVEEVNVVAMVEELFFTTSVLAESHGVPLRLEVVPGTPYVHTDPRRLRQILLNLLSNAVKFGGGQAVVVHCRPARESGVVVEVRDRGSGISPVDQERVFQEFVQLSPADAEQGTGLGLPISRRLATLLGGRLELESTPGVGSTFRLTLPRGVATAAG